MICREGDGEHYYFVFNTSEAQEQTVRLQAPMTNLLTGDLCTDSLPLPPLGVAVFRG